MRYNATLRSKGAGRARAMAAIEQLGGGIKDPKKYARLTKNERETNRKVWKKLVNYGERWLSEIVISSFKRLFGDAVAARKWENVVQEIKLKVDIYNKMLKVQREAIAMV